MDEIFISYAHDDKARVKPIVEMLRENNFNVFWDDDIRTSEDWRRKLEEKLEEVFCVVVVWSKLSEGRDFIRDEADRAHEADKHFPVIIDKEVERLPLGFGKPNYIRLAINGTGSIVEGLDKLREDITEFIEKRQGHDNAGENSGETRLPGDVECLIKSVNRGEQLKQLRPVLQQRDRSLFMFTCQTEDWPEALAYHLASDVGLPSSNTRHDEHMTLSLSKYSGSTAFKVALQEKITRQTNSPETIILDWINSGPLLKVIYVGISPDGGWLETRALLRGTARYIASLEAFQPGRSVVVLIAMITTGRRGWISHRLARYRLSRSTNPVCKCLPSLRTITSIHIEEWVNDFSAFYNQHYDRDRLKERLLTVLPSGKEERYMTLKPKLAQALLEARRG